MNSVYYLEEYSRKTKIPLDRLLLLYLVLEDNLFFVLDQLSGLKVSFPTLAPLKNNFSSDITYLELTNSRYEVIGGWKKIKEIVVGDRIQVRDQSITVEFPVREILGHYYLPIRRKENG